LVAAARRPRGIARSSPRRFLAFVSPGSRHAGFKLFEFIEFRFLVGVERVVVEQRFIVGLKCVLGEQRFVGLQRLFDFQRFFDFQRLVGFKRIVG